MSELNTEQVVGRLLKRARKCDHCLGEEGWEEFDGSWIRCDWCELDRSAAELIVNLRKCDS